MALLYRCAPKCTPPIPCYTQDPRFLSLIYPSLRMILCFLTCNTALVTFHIILLYIIYNLHSSIFIKRDLMCIYFPRIDDSMIDESVMDESWLHIWPKLIFLYLFTFLVVPIVYFINLLYTPIIKKRRPPTVGYPTVGFLRWCQLSQMNLRTPNLPKLSKSGHINASDTFGAPITVRFTLLTVIRGSFRQVKIELREYLVLQLPLPTE